MNPVNEGSNTPTEVMAPTAVEAISKAEINQAIATARAYPRNLHKAKQQMISFATLDEETAESCFYTLPRGGKNIQGPSVRLAEIAVSCYGNVRVGTRIVATDTQSESPHVVIQAVAMDLENNVSISVEKRRVITSKKDYKTGGRRPIDADDVNLAVNACSAIAMRDAIYKVVPMALVKPAYEAARKVAVGDAKTLVDRRAKALDTFAKMGIQKDRVLTKLEKKSIEEIGLEELETLLGLFNAIKEGEINIDDAFPTAPAAVAKQADVSDIKAPTAKTAPKAPGNVTTPVQSDPKPETPATPAQEAPAAANGGDQKQPSQPEPAPEQPQPEPAAKPFAVRCRYCQQEVQDMANHECDPMKEAIEKAEGDPMAESKLVFENLVHLMQEVDVAESQVMAFCVHNKLARKDQKLRQLSNAKLRDLTKAIVNPDGVVLGQIKKF